MNIPDLIQKAHDAGFREGLFLGVLVGLAAGALLAAIMANILRSFDP